MSENRHWQDWFVALIGMWLVVSPWAINAMAPEGMVVPFTGSTIAFWSFALCGLLVFSNAVVAIVFYRIWVEWLNLLFGLWILVSPIAIEFPDSKAALWSALICGMAIILSALWNIHDERTASRA